MTNLLIYPPKSGDHLPYFFFPTHHHFAMSKRHVEDCAQHLLHHDGGVLLGELSHFDDAIEQLTSGAQLHRLANGRDSLATEKMRSKHSTQKNIEK